jgi:hypothetical protein
MMATGLHTRASYRGQGTSLGGTNSRAVRIAASELEAGMDFTTLTTTEMVLIIAVVVIVAVGIGMVLLLRKQRTDRLRNQFGGAEYARAMAEGGSRRHGEAGLDKRTERVESLHVRPLAAGDRCV